MSSCSLKRTKHTSSKSINAKICIDNLVYNYGFLKSRYKVLFNHVRDMIEFLNKEGGIHIDNIMECTGHDDDMVDFYDIPYMKVVFPDNKYLLESFIFGISLDPLNGYKNSYGILLTLNDDKMYQYINVKKKQRLKELPVKLLDMEPEDLCVTFYKLCMNDRKDDIMMNKLITNTILD